MSFRKSSASGGNPRWQGSKRGEPSSARASGLSLAALLGACLFLIVQAAPLHAQEHKSKVPIVGRLTNGNRQAVYSGKIESLNMKQGIMNVNPIEGRGSEIFPLKKNVHVQNLNGGKMALDALTPGTAVLIYFDQKAGERTIKNIVVLSSGKEQAKNRSAPAS